MDNDLFNDLINQGFNPKHKSTVNVAGYPYFGTGLEKKQGDHISITIALTSDFIIRKAWWDGKSSVLGQGMTEYICENVVGLSLLDAVYKKWPEFDQWRHRACTAYPILALKRACSAAYETTPQANGSGNPEEDHSQSPE
jgi:hypothetical protein